MTFSKCNYSECGKPFEVVWGPGSHANKRLYCSPGHREAAYKLRQKVSASRRRNRINARRQALNNAVRGRMCKWEHCQVDDANHTFNWNSPLDICPSCYRQAQRVASCGHCDGPLYHHLISKSLYCPTCEPIQAKPGEISVTLVCLATGRERQIVRRPNWKLPDGTRLSKVQFEGFAVIDLSPKDWARYRV